MDCCLQFAAHRPTTSQSPLNTNDLIGCEAVVTLPLTSHQRGFIEVSVKGSLIRRVALSASQPFEAGARVVIVRDEGTTLVVEPLDLAA